MTQVSHNREITLSISQDMFIREPAWHVYLCSEGEDDLEIAVDVDRETAIDKATRTLDALKQQLFNA